MTLQCVFFFLWGDGCLDDIRATGYEWFQLDQDKLGSGEEPPSWVDQRTRITKSEARNLFQHLQQVTN